MELPDTNLKSSRNRGSGNEYRIRFIRVIRVNLWLVSSSILYCRQVVGEMPSELQSTARACSVVRVHLIRGQDCLTVLDAYRTMPGCVFGRQADVNIPECCVPRADK